MRKHFFKEMHFQFFTTVVLHNKLKLQSEKRIGFSMQKRKAIFVKQHSFVQSSGLHMKMEWDRLTDRQDIIRILIHIYHPLKVCTKRLG